MGAASRSSATSLATSSPRSRCRAVRSPCSSSMTKSPVTGTLPCSPRRCAGASEVPVNRDTVLDWMHRFAAEMEEHRQELVQLDTAIGDGDHGTNMYRGMRKAVEKLDGTDGGDIGADLKAVGMALVSSVGGAAGPLYGTLFLQMGSAAAGKDELDLDGWAAAVEAGIKGVQARGKAEPGDKTMIDALLPALDALKEGGEIGEA